jgi:aquaporin Z
MSTPADESPPEGTSASVELAPQPARGGWHFAEWLSELAGTTILVFVGLSAVTLVSAQGSVVERLLLPESLRLLLLGVIFAVIIILIAISPIGRRSGAHINPAVTLAFRITGHVHPHDLGGYWAGQFAGGLLGAGLLRAAWGSAAASLDYGALQPSVGTLEAIGLEAVMTGALVLAMFAFLSSPRTARWTPVAAGAAVALTIWLGAPATGTGINPARTFGPNIVAGDYRSWWVYFVGPAVGAAVVAAVWGLVPWPVLTAKLYHDSRYPSVLRTHLPARPPEPGS